MAEMFYLRNLRVIIFKWLNLSHKPLMVSELKLGTYSELIEEFIRKEIGIASKGER